MPHLHTSSINMMRLPGTHLIPSPRSGKLALVIDVEAAGARVKHDPKGHRDPEVWFNFRHVPSDHMRNEVTHFIIQQPTEQDYAHNKPTPYIGTGREYPAKVES